MFLHFGGRLIAMIPPFSLALSPAQHLIHTTGLRHNTQCIAVIYLITPISFTYVYPIAMQEKLLRTTDNEVSFTVSLLLLLCSDLLKLFVTSLFRFTNNNYVDSGQPHVCDLNVDVARATPRAWGKKVTCLCGLGQFCWQITLQPIVLRLFQPLQEDFSAKTDSVLTVPDS